MLNSAEKRTLLAIFDRHKSVARDCAAQLSGVIPDLELDSLSDSRDVDSPKRLLVLTQQMQDALRIIECLRLIIVKAG